MTQAMSSRMATPTDSATQRAPHVAGGVEVQRHRLELPPGRAVERVRGRDLPANPGDVGLSVGHRDARAHPADDAEIALAARPFGEAAVEGQPGLQVVGHGGVGRHHQAEAGRHHPDDDRRLPVDVDAPADDGRIAAVAALPDRGAQAESIVGAPVESSLGRNVRPSAASAPSSEK